MIKIKLNEIYSKFIYYTYKDDYCDDCAFEYSLIDFKYFLQRKYAHHDIVALVGNVFIQYRALTKSNESFV